MTPTKQMAVEVATRAVEQRRAGDALWRCRDVGGVSVDEVDFALDVGGLCARFSRQVEDAIRGQGDFTWGYAAPTARIMQQLMDRADLRVDKPEPGDIGFGNNQTYYAGHTFRYLGMVGGVESIAENTSGYRGDPYDPGTKITPLSAVSASFSGWYSSDASAPNLAKWGLAVNGATGTIIGIIPVAGVHDKGTDAAAPRVYYNSVKQGQADKWPVPPQAQAQVWGKAVCLEDVRQTWYIYTDGRDDDKGRFYCWPIGGA